MIELKFYFRLGKELKLAKDEDGNYAEVYSCCTLTVEKMPSDEQINIFEGIYIKAVAGQVDGNIKYITSISEEEYINNVDEE